MSVYRLEPSACVWREIDGELVVIDSRTSEFLGGNSTVALLWPRLAEGATLEQLVGELRGKFDVEVNEAAADVEVFVQELLRRGLVRRGE